MKWKFKGTFKPINYLNQGFSGPIVTDNIVYFGTKGQLYSLDIEKGREKWMFKAGHPEWGPDFFVMSDEIIGVWSKNTLHAVDATTGQEKWIFTCKGVGRISPIVSDGVVYLGRRGERGGDRARLYAVDIKTGLKIWEFYEKLPKGQNYEIISNLVTDGKKVCFGTYYDRRSGDIIYYSNSFLCLNAKTGKTVREGRFHNNSPFAIVDEVLYFKSSVIYAMKTFKGRLWESKEINFCSEPLIVGNVIYFADKSLDLRAVDRKTGQEKWVFKAEGISADDSMRTTYEYNDGLIILSGTRVIYGIDTKTGAEQWKYEIRGVTNSTPDFGDEMLTILTNENVIHAVNTKTGLESLKLKRKRDIVISPQIKNGVLFFGSENYLYAVDIKGISRPTP